MSILVGVSFLEMLSKYWMEIMLGNVPSTYTKKLDQVFKIFYVPTQNVDTFLLLVGFNFVTNDLFKTYGCHKQ